MLENINSSNAPPPAAQDFLISPKRREFSLVDSNSIDSVPTRNFMLAPDHYIVQEPVIDDTMVFDRVSIARSIKDLEDPVRAIRANSRVGRLIVDQGIPSTSLDSRNIPESGRSLGIEIASPDPEYLGLEGERYFPLRDRMVARRRTRPTFLRC